MFYKDNYTEIRLGASIMDFISVLGITLDYKLYKLTPDEPDELVAEFTSDDPLEVYPVDGDYKLLVDSEEFDEYPIYIGVRDQFITEFITQIIDTICNCGCSDIVNPCTETKMGNIALKRQKLFNISHIIPYTIKPFYYGQAALTNEKLLTIYQIYYNTSLDEKRDELGKEFFDYYTKGTNVINMKLFKEIIALNYYSLYYYARTEILPTALGKYDEYVKTINEFFKYKLIHSCFGCSNLISNIEDLINSDTPLPSPVMIYYWQLALSDTINTIIPIFEEATYINKPNQPLIIFNSGVEIVNTSIGRQAFAIVGAPVANYRITDIVLNNDVTPLFDVYYFNDLQTMLYVSKAPYSISTLKIKIKKLNI